MSAPISIGVPIDDTVHFISQYQQQIKEDGDVKADLRRTMAESGPGMVFTSLIFGLGFGIMAIASDADTPDMGKFGTLTIFMGQLSDLFLLPVMIFGFQAGNR